LKNETEFVEKVREASNSRLEADVKASKKRLAKAEYRRDELDTLVTKLYETYILGKLPENHYDRMLAEYDTEQAVLRQEIDNLQVQIGDYTSDSLKADRFMDLARRHTEFDELTPAMLNEFVEKVVIHEADKSTGKRVQKVDVHMNFIGNFDTPHVEIPLSQKEISQLEEAERLKQEKREIRIAKQRENSRRFYDKIKADEGKLEERRAQRRAKYAEKRNALTEQAAAEGLEPQNSANP
jgi:hypothetical protein